MGVDVGKTVRVLLYMGETGSMWLIEQVWLGVVVDVGVAGVSKM